MTNHIIVLPGGSYTNHALHEAEPVVDWLTDLGVSASVYRYPVGVRHPGPLDAVRSEVRRCRNNGAERIGLLGFSAGAHAAGMAAFSPGADVDASVDLAILCYPVVSMLLETDATSRHQLIGPDADVDLRTTTSLDRLVNPDAPPTFVWHTAADEVVTVEHSYLLGLSLAWHQVRHELHVFPSGHHGLGLADGNSDVAQWRGLCATWLDAEGWISAKRRE